MRPEVGTQAQFKKKKSPNTYRYDSSLSPALEWDAGHPAREQGEALIAQLERHVEELRTASFPSPSGRGQGEGDFMGLRNVPESGPSPVTSGLWVVTRGRFQVLEKCFRVR